jgi:molybdopterin molybdotransferase
MDERYPKKPGRAHVVRCKLDAREDGWHVRPTREQGSHILTSMLGADAFAFLEVDRGDVEEGELVWIEPLAYP